MQFRVFERDIGKRNFVIIAVALALKWYRV